MEKNFLVNLLLVLLVLGTMLNFLIPLAIVYLAYVIKKNIGKDTVDRFVKAAELGVMSSEEYASGNDILIRDKKNIAYDIAKKILARDGIYIRTRRERELLEDIVDALIYKIKNNNNNNKK